MGHGNEIKYDQGNVNPHYSAEQKGPGASWLASGAGQFQLAYSGE